MLKNRYKVRNGIFQPDRFSTLFYSEIYIWPTSIIAVEAPFAAASSTFASSPFSTLMSCNQVIMSWWHSIVPQSGVNYIITDISDENSISALLQIINLDRSLSLLCLWVEELGHGQGARRRHERASDQWVGIDPKPGFLVWEYPELRNIGYLHLQAEY